jgi:hypothetical protein
MPGQDLIRTGGSMMCPECQVEYESDVLVCEECEVLLVGDEEDAEEEVEFTRFVESTDVTYFALVTTRLEEAGIPWFVQGETSLGMLPRDGRDLGRSGDEVVTVYVAENRVRDARQLVRDFDPVGAGADD